MSGPLRWSALEPDEEVLLGRRTYGALELFLFSAAGWHPHRIHFDQAYATEVEGHEALVVHGPFQAVHLVDALVGGLDVPVSVRRVAYRHLALLSAGQEALVKGRAVRVADDGSSATFEVWMERAHDAARTTALMATLDRAPEGAPGAPTAPAGSDAATAPGTIGRTTEGDPGGPR